MGSEMCIRDSPTMTLVDGHPALNPALKASPIPPSGELVVDGTVVERAPDAPPPSQADWALGLGLTLWWMALPAGLAALHRLRNAQ